MNKSTTRRNILKSIISFSVLYLARPVNAINILNVHYKQRGLVNKLTEYLSNKQSAQVIGKEYLRMVPNEADPNVLCDNITSFRNGWGQKLARAGKKELREMLDYQQRKDFESGRIVKLHGWILSETEVRLCALVAITHK